MELNEMEKRLIFQTEGYGKSDVTYELRMCLPYIPDPVKRKTAAELTRKLDAMPEKTVWRSFRIFGKHFPSPGPDGAPLLPFLICSGAGSARM